MEKSDLRKFAETHAQCVEKDPASFAEQTFHSGPCELYIKEARGLLPGKFVTSFPLVLSPSSPGLFITNALEKNKRHRPREANL